MRMFLVLAVALATTLFGAAGAQADKKPPPVAGSVTTSSGYIETRMDTNGTVLEVRQRDVIPAGVSAGSDDPEARVTYVAPGYQPPSGAAGPLTVEEAVARAPAVLRSTGTSQATRFLARCCSASTR